MAVGNSFNHVDSLAGTAKLVDLTRVEPGFRVRVFPTGGDTITVETSTTPGAAGAPSTARWMNWTAGAVTAATQEVFTGKLTAVRFTRTVGASTSYYEIAG